MARNITMSTTDVSSFLLHILDDRFSMKATILLSRIVNAVIEGLKEKQ